MSLKEISAKELDLFIKSLRYIIVNPKDNIMQEVFTEDVEVLINSVRKIDRMGLVVSNIMKRLRTIQNLLDKFNALGYTFSNPAKFQLARETVSKYLSQYEHRGKLVEMKYGYKDESLSKPPTRFTKTFEIDEYERGYATALKNFNSGKWTPFVDDGRARSPNSYFGKGVDDAEMELFGSKAEKWKEPRNVKKLEAQAILDMCKEKNLKIGESIRDILKYKRKKGEDIAELTEVLLNKDSSAKDQLDLLLERVSSGLIVYEKRKENEA